MKTIGLIGGMSWESTIPYYSIINEYVKNSLGGLHSARIVLYSVEFDEIERCQSSGNWDRSAEILGDAAKKLEQSGADVILICTNTMHKVYPEVQKMISVPLIHIADATADVLKRDGIKKVALLGTKYTMMEDFYKSRLSDRGFEVIIPDEKDIELVNHVIFDELCLGIINEESRAEFSRIIKEMKGKSAEAVILGCTEIGNLIKQKDSVLPVFDTTVIHAESAAIFALRAE
ncbi:MAG: aspartate/glutamate racemase family protein [Eubacteriales bacterium]|nr:aspartate/glutamate racemase family protein [Eubacteriales bacterium]